MKHLSTSRSSIKREEKSSGERNESGKSESMPAEKLAKGSRTTYERERERNVIDRAKVLRRKA